MHSMTENVKLLYYYSNYTIKFYSTTTVVFFIYCCTFTCERSQDLP